MLNYNAPIDGQKSSIDGAGSPDEHLLLAEKSDHRVA